MKLGYVVLYVQDVDACVQFWTNNVGMIEKGRQTAGTHSIVKVGFSDQDVSFELVPLELMQDNPDGLDLATPSIAFYTSDLDAMHTRLTSNGVQATEPGDNMGMSTFAFSDNEGRWFAVIRS